MKNKYENFFNLINIMENEAIILDNNLKIISINSKFSINFGININSIYEKNFSDINLKFNKDYFNEFIDNKNNNEIKIKINNILYLLKKTYINNFCFVLFYKSDNEIKEIIKNIEFENENSVLNKNIILGKLNTLVNFHKKDVEEKLENEYNKQHSFFQFLINSIPVPIFHMDKNGIYTGVNKAYEKFFGEKESDLIGKSVFDLNQEEQAEEYYKRDRELLINNSEQVYEGNIKDLNGETHHVIFHKSSIVNKNNEITGLIGVITNISKQKEIEEELRNKSLEMEKISLCDGLTQISNRRCFDFQLNKLYKDSLRHSYNLAVMMIDVDYFKPYNDNYGHAQGDETLIKVAKALKNTIKRPNDFLARYGGEEFSIILEDITEEGTINIANELLESIRNLKIKHEFSNILDYITISIGISLFNGRDISKEELLKESDEALYYAKDNGRNQFYIKN